MNMNEVRVILDILRRQSCVNPTGRTGREPDDNCGFCLTCRARSVLAAPSAPLEGETPETARMEWPDDFESAKDYIEGYEDTATGFSSTEEARLHAAALCALRTVEAYAADLKHEMAGTASLERRLRALSPASTEKPVAWSYKGPRGGRMVVWQSNKPDFVSDADDPRPMFDRAALASVREGER